MMCGGRLAQLQGAIHEYVGIVVATEPCIIYFHQPKWCLFRCWLLNLSLLFVKRNTTEMPCTCY